MTRLPRSAMTFKFKGRPRRALLRKKSFYKLWFEYAKVSPRPIPEEFGDLSQFDDFEEWWRHPDYGFELFCEPPEDRPPLEIVSSIETGDEKDVIYLRVNLDEQPAKLKRMFSTVLKNKQKPIPIDPPSKARFKPSIPQKYFRKRALEQYLENWKMRKAGKSRREIYENRYGSADATEEQLRVISREYQRAKEIFEQIEKGTFP